MRKNRTAAVMAAIALALVAPSAAQADETTVTSFPMTEVFTNACKNDEIVIVNGTLMVSTSLKQTSSGMRFEERRWLKDVTATANDGTSYGVNLGNFDAFRTTVRKGQETLRSVQASVLRLKPTVGTGEMRVQWAQAIETNLFTGEQRILFDRYTSTCS